VTNVVVDATSSTNEPYRLGSSRTIPERLIGGPLTAAKLEGAGVAVE
jgi:hypothetical protein